MKGLTGIVLVMQVLGSGACFAGEATGVLGTLPALQQSVAHGSEITREVVGPRAAGYAPGANFTGAEIRGETAPPFARKIEDAAAYDGFDVAGPHLLIEGATFTGPLDIYTPLPVVMRGVTVRLADGGHWAIHTRPGAGPFYFLWSEAGAAAGKSSPGSTALLLRANDATVYRSHIAQASDAIHADAATAVITENLIDALVTHPGDHNDAIQIPPQARNISIERNHIHNRNPQTSCIYNSGSAITVRDNYLSGGGWVIYGGAKDNGHGGPGARDVRFTGNIFGLDYFPKSGHFGPVAYWDRTAIWQRNRFAGGRAIEP